ncbi:hypothetical protein [Actinomadura citrea]|uniref:Uncharacterized protein n=1 Tax=Actinomadura citrea TaxID=46158 RepID=A0A7Y9GHK6_9ACTN|nr:hypothetical protein [Actinomadura citrea]NYE16602.1 hypothetical protein [Actinomadura citrea]
MSTTPGSRSTSKKIAPRARRSCSRLVTVAAVLVVGAALAAVPLRAGLER